MAHQDVIGVQSYQSWDLLREKKHIDATVLIRKLVIVLEHFVASLIGRS